MFTALVVTRLLLNIVVALGATKKGLYGAAKEPKISAYSKRFKYAAAFSIIVILTGIGFLFVNKGMTGRGNTMNFSLEFSGGTSTSVTFNEAYDLQKAEQEVVPVFTELGIENPQIQIVDGTNQVVFKTSILDESKRGELADALKEKFSITNDKIDSQNISSTISSETQRDAILAVVIASLLMLIYIAFRFSDARFGVSAVLALIHDVMFVFFAYSVMYLSVGGTFIACMLTIVGYSINATIVIFDRVRENKKAAAEAMAAEAIAKRRNKKKGKEAPEEGEKDLLKEIVNKSISQTLSRSILTSITTLVMVLCLYIMGVSSIKELALPLIVGIIAGGYSSVFIAGIVWRFLRIKFEPRYEEDDD
jgi:SecD/SecF fusion protein